MLNSLIGSQNIEQDFEDLVQKYLPFTNQGQLANYIPELTKVDKNALGIYVVSSDGKSSFAAVCRLVPEIAERIHSANPRRYQHHKQPPQPLGDTEKITCQFDQVDLVVGVRCRAGSDILLVFHVRVTSCCCRAKAGKTVRSAQRPQYSP